MKIKIRKSVNLNESTLKEERLDEAGALALAARLGPLLAKWGPKIAGAVGLAGGDDADELLSKSKIDPLDIESKTLTQHSQLLDDIKQILQGINAGIAKLPQDPTAVAAGGESGPADAGDVDIARIATSGTKPKPQRYKVMDVGKRRQVDEGKKRVINLKFLP